MTMTMSMNMMRKMRIVDDNVIEEQVEKDDDVNDDDVDDKQQLGLSGIR